MAIANTQQYNFFVKYFIQLVQANTTSLNQLVIICGVTLLILALISGFFMYMMRQTIIVMSRLIEYDQKNELFNKYQTLDLHFLKVNNTGDLMNRISEDVSKVRMYTGPAIMYFINLIFAITMSVYFMVKENAVLTAYVLAPLPILAIIIYYVNTIIHKRSEKIQGLLSELTTTAQESFSGIRVIKSFVQEKAMQSFFFKKSNEYKANSIGLAKIEAIYFPSMSLIIGLSTIITISLGCTFLLQGKYQVTTGTIAEFVLYINFITFPVSAIGWTASMVQRAAASQKRINEFLQVKPEINDEQKHDLTSPVSVAGDIHIQNLSFTYKNTGITALQSLNMQFKKGSKILIVGKTGSGKTTLAKLLLRFYNASSGQIEINKTPIHNIPLKQLRQSIAYVPQDVFLFSDTIANNISFATSNTSFSQIEAAAKQASVHHDIIGFAQQYETVIGERGITLSGGQKQRISIARAIVHHPDTIILDDCLSAVDAKTEKEIVQNLSEFLSDKTAIVITHRLITQINFDYVYVLDEGKISQQGTVNELLNKSGYFRDIYTKQN